MSLELPGRRLSSYIIKGFCLWAHRFRFIHHRHDPRGNRIPMTARRHNQRGHCQCWLFRLLSARRRLMAGIGDFRAPSFRCCTSSDCAWCPYRYRCPSDVWAHGQAPRRRRRCGLRRPHPRHGRRDRHHLGVADQSRCGGQGRIAAAQRRTLDGPHQAPFTIARKEPKASPERAARWAKVLPGGTPCSFWAPCSPFSQVRRSP
jgi:hypothetical protein